MFFFFAKEKNDVKWKSRNISGSASLALWANMNQSTTQLGSKRQSQGKHQYPAINLFTCCCVAFIFQSVFFILFYIFFKLKSYFLLFFFAQVYIYILCVCVVFYQNGFLACSHLVLRVSLLSVCDAGGNCMSLLEDIRTHHSVDIHSLAWTFWSIFISSC